MADFPSVNAELYFSQCTQIPRSLMSEAGQIAYRPDTAEYYKDVFEDKGIPGVSAAGVALILGIVIWLGSCCLFCVSPRGMPDTSEFGKIGEGPWWKRLLSFLLVISIFALTVVVIGMSIWGIYETEDKVKDVVPESFRLIMDTEAELVSVERNLTETVNIGQDLVVLIDRTVERIERNEIPALQLSESEIDSIRQLTDDAAEDVQDIASVLDENVRVYIRKVQDVLGYRDESDRADRALRAILITSFTLMIIFALFVSIHAVFIRKPRWTIAASVLMWLLLTLAFAFGVGFVSLAREVNEDTCLYMNEFAIDKVQEAIDFDKDRIDALLRYYFVAPDAETLPLEDLENLWDIPVSDVTQFLDTYNALLFNDDGTLRFDRDGLDQQTLQDLDSSRVLIARARNALDAAVLVISGTSWRILHKNLKDLVCCTVYDAVDSIWIAWVVSSIAAFLLAIAVTYQVIKTIWMKSPPTKPSETRKAHSAYVPADAENGIVG